MCLQKSEKNNGLQRNDEVQGLNDEGPGLYVHLKKEIWLVGLVGQRMAEATLNSFYIVLGSLLAPIPNFVHIG